MDARDRAAGLPYVGSGRRARRNGLTAMERSYLQGQADADVMLGAARW